MYPHPRSPEALRILAQYRGSSVGFEMAEGFMLLRKRVDTLDTWGGIAD